MARRLIPLLTLVLVEGSALAGPYDVGSGRCPSLLGNNVYQCAVKGDDGSSFTDCFRFATPGKLSGKFAFVSDQLGTAVGCTCDPAGNPGKPRFNAAASFTCNAAEGVSFHGSVLQNGKIARGSAANLSGGSYAFNCQRDAACTPQ